MTDEAVRNGARSIQQRRRAAALHEAGHAVAERFLGIELGDEARAIA